jgi:hypothetical protein
VRDNGLFALGPDAELVSEVLRDAGWRTGAFVGSFVLEPRFGLDQGFEVYDAPKPTSETPLGFVRERRAVAVVDRFLAWAATLQPGERFFAWVHFFDPHYPYTPPPGWRFEDLHPYDQEIAYIDDQLGRLLRGLEERGHAEKLLVVVTADHGESAGEHGEDSHGVFVYQSTLRVPLILWGPALGGRAGQRVGGLASLLELPATLLGFAGVAVESLPHAASTPLVAPGSVRRPPEPDRPIYLESLLPYHSFRWRGLRGVVENGYKLVDSGSPELYALFEDPHERSNLAAQEPEHVASLRARLEGLGAPGVDLGWGAPRELDAGDLEQLRALGYLSQDGGEDPFSNALPDPRDRLEDLALVTTANRLVHDASRLQALEPGAFAEDPAGGEVPGRPQMRKARRTLQRLLERNADDPWAQAELAKVLSLLAVRDRALPLLEGAVSLRPADPVLHYHLAHAYDAAGQPAEARLAMRTALALDPQDPRYAVWLSEHRDGR